MTVSYAEFVEGLAASRLMTADEVRLFREGLPPERRLATVAALRSELIAARHLTEYQAERIALGRPLGLVLGNYEVVEKIGEGGMGEVFKARHRRMNRVVAVKVLPIPKDDPDTAVRRFQREVEAAARLVHHNIVTAFDADVDDGLHFLVMEYVEGVDLVQQVHEKGALPMRMAIDCTLQAARGLDYAHHQNIIHRDIKPSNLLIDKYGRVKILDMGLARLHEDEKTRNPDHTLAQLTQSGEIMGTFDYMSPEQAEDARCADPRSDIYSLGCTMYSLLTADVPYGGDTMMKKLLAHREHEIPKIGAVRTDAPERLDEVFARMVAKKPDERYQKMSEVVNDLEDLLSDPSLDDGDFQFSFTKTTTTPVKTVQTGPTVAANLNLVTAYEQTGIDTKSVDERDRIPAVGIDLGTTFSVVAVLDDEGRPGTILNAEGDKLTPSVMLFEDEGVLVGKEAVRAMATEMEQIAECPKRDVGQRMFHKALDNRQYPPEALEAWILNKLRRDAHREVGEFQKVVITVPAYFDEVRRKATQDAGYMAGFDVLDIINEPTAAALSFGFQRGILGGDTSGVRKKVLVYDLGGGTFDVSIMDIGDNDFTAVATDGDVQLGGRDFDKRLVDHVADAFQERYGVDPREDPNVQGRLWRECEDAKRTLSARQRAVVVCEYQGHALRQEITRDQFQKLTADLLDRTRFTVRETLTAAALEWSDIDHVLLVGGSTRMPAVSEMLRSLTGKEPDRSVSPDEAVAHGAALHAGLMLDMRHGRTPKFKVQNVSSHSLGVVAADKRTGRRKNAVLIRRNTPLPATRERTFKTQKAGQEKILVEIVEGESKRADECAEVGRCMIEHLPPDLPDKTPVKVRFRYEENGRLTVKVRVKGSDEWVKHEIIRENSLSPEQLDNWRNYISGEPPLPYPSRRGIESAASTDVQRT